jgi:hypothetical protein
MEFALSFPHRESRPPRANPFYAFSAEDPTPPATPPTQIISRIQSQRELLLSQRNTRKQNERERELHLASTRIYLLSELVAQKENRPPSTKKHNNLAQQEKNPPGREGEMAGRGRGRPGGGTNLKGITWEYDPSIKLESKPIELFPVRYAPSNR